MKAMILAAGQGKRLRPLTLTCPKPLIKAGGKEFIAWHLEKLKASGIRDIIVNSAYLSDKIVDFINSYQDRELNLKNSVEEGEGLETAGGIIKALDFFDEDEPFLVVNGDIFVDCDYSLFTSYKMKSKDLAHLFLIRNPKHNLKGDFSIQEGDRLAFGHDYTFSGAALYKKQAFLGYEVQRLALRPVFDQLIKQCKVSAKFIDVPWFDVGTVERLELLSEYLQKSS